MTSTRRVGVVMGGTSAEREISLRSGLAVAEALERVGHDVVPVILGEDTDAFLAISAADLDVAFLALHGRLGEDGCIQGLLELLGIPYTGSSVLSSALAMDKLKAKEMFRLHNVPTPPYYTLDVSQVADLDEVHGSFGFPVIVWGAVLPFIVIFLAMDVLLATLACILEREPIVRAWRILPMRLIYRPMLSYCVWKAILRAIKGAWVSWGKLERTASVPVRA